PASQRARPWCVRANRHPPPPMKAPTLANAPIPPAVQRIRAVIVDDEPAARRGIRLLLERDGGVDVVGEASGGAEAAELIMRERPDLAFLDVQMPGCDGFQTLVRAGTSIPPAVIFVT